jgi:hypothetical protein
MIRYSAKTVFYFDKLATRIKIGKNRALYRTAGLVRLTARRLLRVRSGPGRPGAAPHAHTRGGLREIRFSVFGNVAIVGPTKFANSTFWDEPVPHIHEFGGIYISRRSTRATYPQRSYMGVTIERLMSKGKIPKQFSVSIAQAL